MEAPPQDLAVHKAQPEPAPKPPARKSRHRARPEPTPRTAAVPVDPMSLIGMGEADVRSALGMPHRVKSSHLSLSWFYDAPGCTARVIFYPSLNNGALRALKFSSVDDNGDPVDADSACVTGILTARKNAH
jgi:hypothetical protein